MTFDIRVQPSPSTKDATEREGTKMLTYQQQCSQSTYLFCNLNTSTVKNLNQVKILECQAMRDFHEV